MAVKNTHLNRKFGWVTGGACLLIFAFQLIFKHRPLFYLGGTGSLLVLLALWWPQVLNPLRIAWEKIGSAMGLINTYLILSGVFFLIITPIGWIQRLMKKNLITKKWSKEVSTYWQPISPAEEGKFHQQF